MSELFVLVTLLAVGKIHGREVDASRVLLIQPVPELDHRPVLHRENGRYQTPAPISRLYTNAYRPADHSRPASGTDNLNLTPTVRENEQQRLFISTKISAKMERPLDKSAENIASKPSTVDDDGYFVRNNVPAPNDNVNLVIPPKNNTSDNVPAVQPIHKSIGVPVMVAVDERSSFDGDCAPGYVRINGECVKKD